MNLPDLGAFKQHAVQPPPTHATVAPTVLMREMDANGLIKLTNGQLTRSDTLDATQLLDEVRRVVRAELRVFAVRIGAAKYDEESPPYEAKP